MRILMKALILRLNFMRDELNQLWIRVSERVGTAALAIDILVLMVVTILHIDVLL